MNKTNKNEENKLINAKENKMKKETIRKAKGVTMLALVVTIIVLLILARNKY